MRYKKFIISKYKSISKPITVNIDCGLIPIIGLAKASSAQVGLILIRPKNPQETIQPADCARLPIFLPQKIALMWAPVWYRRARHPDDQPEVDRLLSYLLRDAKIPSAGTGQYTVNYRAGNRADSVKPEFFLQGNEIMMKKYNGDLPWRKRKK